MGKYHGLYKNISAGGKGEDYVLRRIGFGVNCIKRIHE
jgi:hypothetical protein